MPAFTRSARWCLALVAVSPSIGLPCLADKLGELPAPQATAPDSAGDAWMLQVLSSVSRRESLTARILQTFDVDGSAMYGTGKYWQQGIGDKMKVCLELQLRVLGETAHLRQISDGRVIWTDRDLAGKQHVERINLRELRRAWKDGSTSQIDPLPGMAAARPLMHSSALVGGGVPQLVASLIENFHFEPPVMVMIGEQRFLSTIGHWKAKRLSRLWPSLFPDASSEGVTPELMPPQLPTEVMLRVSERELLPLLIEYRRRQPPTENSHASTGLTSDQRQNQRYEKVTQPMVRLEFTAVRTNVSITPVRFHYSPPGDVEWTDETRRVLEQWAARNDP